MEEQTVSFGGLGTEGFITAIAALAVLILVFLLKKHRKTSCVKQRPSLAIVLGAVMLLVSAAYLVIRPSEGNLLYLFIDDGYIVNGYDAGVWNETQRLFVQNNLRGIKTLESLTDGTMFCNALIAVFSVFAASLAASLLKLLLRCDDAEEWSLPGGILMDVGTSALAITLLLNVGKWLYLCVLALISWVSSLGILGFLLAFALVLGIAAAALYFIATNCLTFLCATIILMIAGIDSYIVFIILYLLIETGFLLLDTASDSGGASLRLYLFIFAFVFGIVLSIVKLIFGTGVMQIFGLAALVGIILYFRPKRAG